MARSGPERRPRGWLEADLNRVLKQVMTGEVGLREGVQLTASTMRHVLVEVDQTPSEDAPSRGAIEAVFDRWERMGYAYIAKAPKRFVDFTEEGQRLGLEVMQERIPQEPSDSEVSA